jgi:hypothetical protein
MNDRVQEEARTKKKRLVTQTLTNALLNASPTPSCNMSSVSPETTVSTTNALESFLREWREMDRRWVATDRLAGKVVLYTLYAALVPCPCFFFPDLMHANCIHISLHIPTYTYFYMYIHAFYIIYIYTHIYIAFLPPIVWKVVVEQLVAYAQTVEEKAVAIAKHKALLQKMLDLDDEIQHDLAEAVNPDPATSICNGNE